MCWKVLRRGKRGACQDQPQRWIFAYIGPSLTPPNLQTGKLWRTFKGLKTYFPPILTEIDTFQQQWTSHNTRYSTLTEVWDLKTVPPKHQNVTKTVPANQKVFFVVFAIKKNNASSLQQYFLAFRVKWDGIFAQNRPDARISLIFQY